MCLTQFTIEAQLMYYLEIQEQDCKRLSLKPRLYVNLFSLPLVSHGKDAVMVKFAD